MCEESNKHLENLIEFIKEKAEEDAYLQSFYKSYAILLYSKRNIPEDSKVFDIDWLTEGAVDKDAYFVLRIDKKDEIMSRYSNIKVIEEKNGYVFCKREAQAINK